MAWKRVDIQCFSCEEVREDLVERGSTEDSDAYIFACPSCGERNSHIIPSAFDARTPNNRASYVPEHMPQERKDAIRLTKERNALLKQQRTLNFKKKRELQKEIDKMDGKKSKKKK